MFKYLTLSDFVQFIQNLVFFGVIVQLMSTPWAEVANLGKPFQLESRMCETRGGRKGRIELDGFGT